MAKYIDIAGRRVGLDYEPLVIAEVGINHGGSLQVAKEMVDAAARAGIEIVKHQTHIVECEMSDEAKKVIPGNSDQSIYHIMERCSLNEAEEMELQKYVQSKGMIFISTPFSFAAVDIIIPLLVVSSPSFIFINTLSANGLIIFTSLNKKSM